MRCAWEECWPNSRPPKRKYTASSRSWKFNRPASPRERLRTESRSCCSIRIERSGINFFSALRGAFLVTLGRLPEAQDEFARAASLTSNARERELLLTRARKAQHGSA